MQNADEKKKALLKDLLDAENQLKNIKRGRTSQGVIGLAWLFDWEFCSVVLVHNFSSFFFKSDDIGNIIDEAKRKAASANSTATDTMNKLNDIRKEVDKINVSPSDSNLKNVLDGVDQTGEVLNRSLQAH